MNKGLALIFLILLVGCKTMPSKEVLGAPKTTPVVQELESATTNITGKTYSFNIPLDVTAESSGHMDLYSFKWGPNTNDVCLLFTVNPDNMKFIYDKMASDFEEGMQDLPPTSSFQKNQTDVTLGFFKGIETEFIIDHSSTGRKIKTYFFDLNDGTSDWFGQLLISDSSDAIKKAHDIIKNANPLANQNTHSITASGGSK
ncbi:hypothetical protein [Tichowtungia aerotolerans]|uniref:Lipoprotein n=1 Tax=Tichowtungia aerotolerans TaxID=2697043 RepID=A0A6P1M9H9_9BACT|nr:hypothetical protein [Tichowtungia aerotolerans]QHI68728.1 hypothetical protein GT409_04450 [Tichowtungia aerotolerans]